MPRPRLLNHDMANQLYQQGLCDDDIAGRCCVSRRTVQAWRQAAGLPSLRPRPQKRTDALPSAVPKSQLAADAAEARAHGMNYGAYYAAYIAPRRQAKAGRKRGGKS